uniref:Transposase n=1 Tax=Parastrongyloides trichosuri TaxID=131310 RepID=A0A0N4Z403_PARTI
MTILHADLLSGGPVHKDQFVAHAAFPQVACRSISGPVRPVGPRPVQRPGDALGREAFRPALHPAAGGYLRRSASAVRRARSGAGRHPALQRRTRRRSGAGWLQCGRGLRPADRRHPGLSGTAARRRYRRRRRRGRAAACEPAADHQPALSLARVGIAVRVLPPLRVGRDDRP